MRFWLLSILTLFITTATYAEGTQIFNKEKLPDGSTSTEFGEKGSAVVKEVLHPDGTIDTIATDGQGHTTTIVTQPDGSVESSDQDY